ncbi:MAG: hypothetical protein DYG94_10755 [Leptolyngbya sp. PLA3]|nr:MAG: hypothetical protein EDM82_08220 [Cyanobacteria bacterium CYA]MCE7969210.1 hypothetical protein [Leptolyngbya sp. PL-A3]
MQTDPDIQSRHLRRARLGKRRRLILGFWLVQSVLVYASWPLLLCMSLSDLNSIGKELGSPGMMGVGLTLVAGVTMAQLIFVMPVRPPARKSGTRARVPVWVRLLLAAAVATPIGVLGVMLQSAAMMLNFDDTLLFSHGRFEAAFWLFWLIGLVPAVPIVVRLCRRQLSPIISAYIAGACTGLLGYALAVAAAGLVRLVADVDISDLWMVIIGGTPLLLGWIVSTPLLLAFIGGQDTETALKKLASLIFVGTSVEILAIIPLDVFTRRKSDCYCAEGSLWALLALVPLGFVALGPMIFLVAASKRRKRYAAGCCEICGYDMTGNLKAERCPECGAGWKALSEALPSGGADHGQSRAGG